MSITNPNPLANPKGVNLNCELCRKPAFVICKKCRVTYYCSYDHQKIDDDGIHSMICDKLIPLRAATPFLPSEEERANYHKEISRLKHEVIHITQTEGQRLLFEGKHERAVPAAMQCLKFSIDIYGLSSMELVSPYLILGEACVGLGQFVQGEEYLAQAQWTALKAPDCPNSIKSKLFRNIAMLNEAKGAYDEASRNLADDIYHSSEEYGPDDINTSGGYFHLANVFFRQGKHDIANSLYAQVSQIWMEYLQKIVAEQTRDPVTKGYFTYSLSHHDVAEVETFDRAREAEGMQVLHAVYDIRHHEEFRDQIQAAISTYCLGMLYFIIGKIEQCTDFMMRAQSFGLQLESCQLSDDIAKFCEYLSSHHPIKSNVSIENTVPTDTNIDQQQLS